MKYFFLSLLLVSTSLAEGVANKVTPLGPFPATWNQYNKGSVMTWMTNVSQLTTLFANQREPGMSSVINGDTYILAPDLTTWTLSNPLVSVGLASGFSTLNPLAYSLNTILSTLGNTSYTNGSGGYYTIASSTEFPADSLGILSTANTNFNVVLVNNGQPWKIRQLGVIANGVTDDLAKMQGILTRDRYDAIELPPGARVAFSTQIAVTNGVTGRTNGNLTIIGDGSHSSIFVPTSAYTTTPPNSTPPSDNSVAMDFNGFRSLNFKGWSKQYASAPTWAVYTNWFSTTFVARAYGIRIRNCDNVTLDDIGLLNSIHIGLGVADYKQVTIRNCWVTNSIKDGIILDSNTEDNGRALIQGCYVYAFGDTGIGVLSSTFLNRPPHDIQFKDNFVVFPKDFSGRYANPRNTSQALTIVSASDVIATGNTFDGGIGVPAVTFISGINTLAYSTNFTFANNIVRNGLTNDFFFAVNGVRNVNINNNIFQNCQGTLTLQNNTNCILSYNQFDNCIQWRPYTNNVTTNLNYYAYSPGGSGTVTYNSVTYTNRQTFSGVVGITNYTFAGDGQMIPRYQGLIRVAGAQINTVLKGNIVSSIEGPFLYQTANPLVTFVDDNIVPRSWSLGYDPFYGTVLLDAGGTGFSIGDRNYFGDSTNYVTGPVVINAPSNNRLSIKDRATDLISDSTILATTNLTLTLPDIGVSHFWVHAIGTSPGQNTNSVIRYAFGQMVGQAYSANHWEQLTNGPTSGNRRLLREKNYWLSNGGPESGYNIITNLQGNFQVLINYAIPVSIRYRVEGINYR